MNRIRARPETAARPLTTSSAASAPMKTPTGSSYFATSEIVSSCERSPHSAANRIRKQVSTILAPWTSLALAATSASSSSALWWLRPSRNSSTAPARKIRPATARTRFSGRYVTAWPSATATIVWTVKARPTPIHTSSGRYFVASTRVATNVLSGSSTTKIATKVRAMTTGSMRGSGLLSEEGAARGHGIVQYVEHRAAERGGGARHVVVLRLGVDQHTVVSRQLDRDRLAVDLDRDHLTVQRVLAERLLAQADRGGLPEDLGAHSGRAVGGDQDAEGVRGAALLHQDRGQPGVGGARLEQRGDHRRPHPGVEVVDVGLDQ